MAKNRKLLIEKFKSAVPGSAEGKTLFTFQQGKQALDDWVDAKFKGSINDE